MRITLLEHPREASAFHFNDIANTPLWSCLMTGYAGATLLRAGLEADIVDARLWTFPDTVQYLVDHPADLLAVHAVYFWEKTEALLQMLGELRRRQYEGQICLYGFFPTLTWKDILHQVPAIDYVIVGEPEETLVDLARGLKTGTGTQVKGLAARVQGKATLAGLRPPLEPLDRLPFPLRPSLEAEETVSILASRGCYNRCSFCLIPTLNGGRAFWRGRSAENVAGEIAELLARGKQDFYFVDPNFIGPGKAGKEHALRLARSLAGLGITFGMETRANDVTGGLMRALVEAGLTSLLLGIESGRPQVLQRLGKHTNIAQNELAIALVREAGLEPEIGFIMFDAASTLEDVAENLSFLQRNRLLHQLGRSANLLYHDHIALKGTRGYDGAQAEGRLVPQGLFGFEGRLRYEDYRVEWLAGLMKRLCQSVLREMGRPSSPIYWRAESPGREPYQAVNDQLVEIFKGLLGRAEAMTHMPEANFTESLCHKLQEELQGTLKQTKNDLEETNGGPKRSC